MTKIRKFKIGDKVKCVAGAPKGRKGVVIAIVGDEFPYGVEFDKNYDGVGLCGRLVARNGSWCDENQLEYDDVFKVGDKVRYIGAWRPLNNSVGTIVHINNPNSFAVAFKNFEGHTCSGHIPTANGWWCPLSELELIEDTKKEIKVGDRVLHSIYAQEATVTDIIDDDMVKIAFDHTFKDIKPCNYKSYYAFIHNLKVIEHTPTETQAEPIRDPETGSLPCCEPNACMPVNEVPEDAKDCPERVLSCCLDEVPVVPERYFDAHYGGDVQPIELMQMILTPEQFIGFLMGNIIKYSMRCGKKDAPEKELTKIRRYKAWLDQARNGEIINPRV